MDRKISMVLIAVLVFAGACSTGFVDSATKLTLSGGRLTPEEVAVLENKIVENPRNIAIRTSLLGYYFTNAFKNPSFRKNHKYHVLWMILNAPESEVLELPYGHIYVSRNAEAYAEAKDLWIKQTKKYPKNIKLLGNASSFFLMGDRELSEKMLKKAHALDMDNPKWPKKLGHLYSLGMGRKSLKARRDVAKKALQEFELAYELTSAVRREYLLGSLSVTAFEANELIKAKGYAEKMLVNNHPGWNYGNNIHGGNTMLGRIALGRDDIEEATRRLMMSGETPGSPTLNSFGPRMTLAKALLEKGEKDVVLKYFEKCSFFWKHGKKDLAKWSTAIKAGKIPDFGANLNSG